MISVVLGFYSWALKKGKNLTHRMKNYDLFVFLFFNLNILIEHIIMNGPSFGVFIDLRRVLLRKQLMPGSGSFTSFSGLWVPWKENVFIGNRVSINRNVTIDASGGCKIIIQDNCLIGPYVLIRAADHCFDDTTRPINTQGHKPGNIIIEEDCWIGGHVTITKNVTIGRGSVIGANSVVTRDIPPFSVAAGNPAKVIRSRLNKKED